MQRLMMAFMLMTLAVFAGGPAHAYSYDNAGKEPLIDGRDAIDAALDIEDWGSVAIALERLKPELDYLDTHEGPGISKRFQQAVAAKDQAALHATMYDAFVDEIDRRIGGARQNIAAFQTAKMLLVDAQSFYTAFAGEVPGDKRPVVTAGFTACLKALGNPGVFGVGKIPPNPDAMDDAHKAILAALRK